MPEIQLSLFSPVWAFFPPLLKWQFLAGFLPGEEAAHPFGMKEKGFTLCRACVAQFGLGFAGLQWGRWIVLHGPVLLVSFSFWYERGIKWAWIWVCLERWGHGYRWLVSEVGRFGCLGPRGGPWSLAARWLRSGNMLNLYIWDAWTAKSRNLWVCAL